MATAVVRENFFMTPSDSPDRKIGIGANSAQLFFTGTDLYRFEISIDISDHIDHPPHRQNLVTILQLLNGCYGNMNR